MKSISSRRRRARATATALALSPGLLLAQGTSPQPNPSSVMITGNPLRSADIAAPASVLSGNDLVRRRGSTLGETLDGLPGLSSSYFGPNANRPMIRGQDGDRIRVLSNSGVPLDASALSYDHAVPIDPLVIERVEVLRGPAALLYGGSAVGGVVNAIDNRIPKAALDGVSGAAELRYGGPATERGAAALVESGGKGFVVHADGFWRQTDDMKVPWYSRPLEGGGSERVDTILNSASKSYGGALGGSMVWDKGYLGASIDNYHSDYGVVAEEDVTIDMDLNKLTLAGEARDLGGAISAVSGQWLFSDYQHQEIEGGGARSPPPSRTAAPTCVCRPSMPSCRWAAAAWAACSACRARTPSSRHWAKRPSCPARRRASSPSSRWRNGQGAMSRSAPVRASVMRGWLRTATRPGRRSSGPRSLGRSRPSARRWAAPTSWHRNGN